MRTILAKLFPRHTIAVAAFILALLATAALTGLITLSDYFRRGLDLYQVGFVLLCLGLAGVIYVAEKQPE